MQIDAPPILKSKKFFAAALASILSYFGVRYNMTPAQIGLITGPLYTYIVGQAAADFGKEREKVKANGTKPKIVVSNVTGGTAA